MYSLLYKSLALLPERDTHELDMLNQAVSRNQREGVTGILHRESDAYFQWLEGPRQAVEAIYSTIQKDSRHHRVVCLSEGGQDRRFFENWSMAYSNSNDESLFDWAVAENLSLLNPDPAEILAFLLHRSSVLPNAA